MTRHGFALFDTAIGRCAIAWAEGGLVGLKLPERSDAAMRARMVRQHPEAREAAPPQEIEAAIADIRRLLDGHKQDLSRIVGAANGRNAFSIVVPCHRVFSAGGKSGGFSAVGGVETKRRLLEIEGARDLHPTLPWDPVR